ncbi:MAG: PD40 domain-containing protein, partial [Acidobacteriota bacterium]
DVSPSGARAVFEVRGEIVTVPAEKGDPRFLTRTSGAHERFPVWSPDGTRIAYFSDASGEYELHLAAQDGKGPVRRYSLGGAGFYERPRFSPDGRKLSFIDNSRSLYWIDLETGKVRKVFSEILYGPVNTMQHAWSPDSRWLAYTRLTPSYLQQVCLYSLTEDRSYPITDGLADAAEAVWDASGKYLYLAASTDAGPVRDWFSMSNNDMEMTNTLYLVVLGKGEPSPLARQSDEEKPAVGGESKPARSEDKDKGNKDLKGSTARPEEVRVVVDLEGIAQRILPLPVKGALFTDLQPGARGQLFYRRSTGGASRFSRQGEAALVRFDLDKREETVLAEKADLFALARDGARVLLRQGQTWLIAETRGKIDTAKGKLDLDAVAVRVEPRTEWRQIFHEAWRINRDYFYDPNFHGADWAAMRAKYEPFLEHAATRADVNRIIQWMCSELAVGHHR